MSTYLYGNQMWALHISIFSEYILCVMFVSTGFEVYLLQIADEILLLLSYLH
jgi:hypothetical protein